SQLDPQHPDLHSLPTRRSSDLFSERPNFSFSASSSSLTLLLAASSPMAMCSRISGSSYLLSRAAISSRVSAARWLASASVASERSEEHTSELQSRENLVCRLLL